MCLLPRRGLIWYLCNCLNYNMNTFFEKTKRQTNVYWNAGWGGFLKFVDSIRIEYECDCLLLKDQEWINNIYFFDRAQVSTESTALNFVPPSATLDKSTMSWLFPEADLESEFELSTLLETEEEGDEMHICLLLCQTERGLPAKQLRLQDQTDRHCCVLSFWFPCNSLRY